MEPFHFTISFWSVLNFKIQYTFFVKKYFWTFRIKSENKIVDSDLIFSSFEKNGERTEFVFGNI